jgi:hypothetical protein
MSADFGIDEQFFVVGDTYAGPWGIIPHPDNHAVFYLTTNYGGGELVEVNYAAGTARHLPVKAGGFSIDPFDHNRMLVVGDGSDGIYESLDGGASWHPLTQEQLYAAWHVTFSPGIRDLVYVYTHEAGSGGTGRLHRSTDGGMTWSENALLGGPVKISGQNPSRVYSTAGWAQPLQISDDAGITWTSLGVYAVDFEVDPFDGNTIFVTGYQDLTTNHLIAKSTDGGTTWQFLDVGNLGIGNATSYAIKCSKFVQGLVYAAVESYNTRVVRSTDGGQTWNLLNTLPGTGLPSGGSVTELVSGPPGPSGEIPLYAINGLGVAKYLDFAPTTAAPVASAGSDETVQEGNTVVLSGDQSQTS